MSDAPEDTTPTPPEVTGGFSRRGVVWLISIFAFSMALAILLMAFGEDLSRKPTSAANTFSYSLIGHRAFVEFLEDSGIGVFARQTRAGIGTGPKTPLFLIAPDVEWVRSDETKRMAALQAEGARKESKVVLVLPKWRGTPQKEKEGWVQVLSELSLGDINTVLSRIDDSAISSLLVTRKRSTAEGTLTCTANGRQTFTVDIAPAQLIRKTPTLSPIVTCGRDILIGRRFIAPDGPDLFVVADPDLLNNQGLARSDNALLMQEFVSTWLDADGVVIDETVHGFIRKSGLLYELFRFPLVLAVLQSLLFLGIVMWAGVQRFGKPDPTLQGIEARGKNVLIDNTAKLLSYGGHSGASLMQYFRATVRAVAQHYFLPPDLAESEMISQVTQIAKGRGLELDLEAMRRRIQFLSKSGTDDRVVKIARLLHSWRTKMTTRTETGEST